jgi:hypothetical protein
MEGATENASRFVTRALVPPNSPYEGRVQSRSRVLNQGKCAMTYRLKFLIPAAAGVALGAVAFANVALAQDTTPKPDATAAEGDHMSADHMAPMKKHHMKKHMTKEGDHMAPEAPK